MNQKSNNWHFARPDLAGAYLKLFEVGLTSARGLFARRRMGKTQFLMNDLIPAAQADGYLVVYANLWDLEIDPATALVSAFYQAVEPKEFKKIWSRLKFPIDKLKVSGKISGIGEGALEANLANNKRMTGTTLMEAMKAFDKTKKQLMLIIDEAQVLAYEDNAHFAHALRAALDVRKHRIKVVFAGSSETTLRRMFGVSSEPFYNWAPLEPFELLSRSFVEAMVERINNISIYPLSLADALDAFSELKNTPEFFRRYIEHYICNPLDGSIAAINATKSKVFSDAGFKQQWEALLAADKIILSMIANGISDLHSKAAIKRLGTLLGVGDSVDKNTIQNALRRLAHKNIVTKIEQGIYQFEDEALADWVRHIE
jgi:hypothetical protein